MTETIRAANLIVAVGRQTVLRQASMVVKHGCAAVLGGAGTGKSILLRTMLGQARRSEGSLEVCGLDPQVDPLEIGRRVTYITGPEVFEPHLTIRQNVEHILRLARTPVPSRIEIDRALRDAEVPDRAITSVAYRLSALVAIQTWLAIARLRLSHLVLLDEPSKHLNALETSQLAALIRDVASRQTVVVATRDTRFAEDCASTIYRLDSGRLLLVPRSQ